MNILNLMEELTMEVHHSVRVNELIAEQAESVKKTFKNNDFSSLRDQVAQGKALANQVRSVNIDQASTAKAFANIVDVVSVKPCSQEFANYVQVVSLEPCSQEFANLVQVVSIHSQNLATAH